MRVALAVIVTLVLFVIPASAQGWDWFAAHVHPTGKCGGAREVGASMYNSGYRTSSGERFDPNALAAASNAGGFSGHVSIRNPLTGQSITVRVNDTLPHGKAWSVGVRLDLTPAAFHALGMRQSGWVCVL